MNKENGGISIGTAALITGLTIFIPTAPYAEFFVFKKLIISNDAAQTTQNLIDHPQLFLSGIFAIFFTYIKDVLLAWTGYIFLRPVNPSLSLLAGWLRIVYTVLAIVALFNFLYAFQLVTTPGLGLALCKKIVERHGGAIAASGQEMEGATFEIILPVKPRKKK